MYYIEKIRQSARIREITDKDKPARKIDQVAARVGGSLRVMRFASFADRIKDDRRLYHANVTKPLPPPVNEFNIVSGLSFTSN